MLELQRAGAEARHVVRIGSLAIGASRPVLIAGPCSVEPTFVEQAEALAAAGVDALRAGVFKPRTHPDSFQGMGLEALPLLAEATRRTGLPLISEVMSPADAEAIGDHVDGFQVGARNMQNYRLLEALGDIGRPVILKRGLSATIDEWIASSEYVRRRGNHDVVLCERGIRTFETATRNTLDISAVPVAQRLSHLPVIVDPSHSGGRRDLVLPLTRAAIAVGTDGVIVDVHPEPARALCDGDQALDHADIAELAGIVSSLPQLVGRNLAPLSEPAAAALT